MGPSQKLGIEMPANDAVISEVDSKLLAELGLVEVESRATSKAHFLQRPAAGRALCDEARARRLEKVTRGQQLVLV